MTIALPTMPRVHSSLFLIAGGACCAFAAIWFFWLLLANIGDLLDLLAAASSSSAPREQLARHGLTRPGPIRFTFMQWALQAALLGVLIWTGCALLLHWPSARWCALSYSGFAIVITLLGTIIRLFFLTLPSEVVKVGPFVLDAAVIVFAIGLGAAMIVPGVAAVDADKAEPAGAENVPIGE